MNRPIRLLISGLVLGGLIAAASGLALQCQRLQLQVLQAQSSSDELRIQLATQSDAARLERANHYQTMAQLCPRLNDVASTDPATAAWYYAAYRETVRLENRRPDLEAHLRKRVLMELDKLPLLFKPGLSESFEVDGPTSIRGTDGTRFDWNKQEWNHRLRPVQTFTVLDEKEETYRYRVAVLDDDLQPVGHAIDHPRRVTTMKCCTDGEILASVDESGSLRVFRIRDGSLMFERINEKSSSAPIPNTIFFGPRNDYVLFECRTHQRHAAQSLTFGLRLDGDSVLEIVRPAELQGLTAVRLKSSEFLTAHLVASRYRTTSDSDCIVIWNSLTGTVLVPPTQGHSVDMATDGRHVIITGHPVQKSESDSQTVSGAVLLDLTNGESVSSWPGVSRVVWSPDSKLVALVKEFGLSQSDISIVTVDMERDNERYFANFPDATPRVDGHVDSMAFSPDGNCLAVARRLTPARDSLRRIRSEYLDVIETATGRKDADFYIGNEDETRMTGSNGSVRFSPNGKTLVYGNKNRLLVIQEQEIRFGGQDLSQLSPDELEHGLPTLVAARTGLRVTEEGRLRELTAEEWKSLARDLACVSPSSRTKAADTRAQADGSAETAAQLH